MFGGEGGELGMAGFWALFLPVVGATEMGAFEGAIDFGKRDTEGGADGAALARIGSWMVNINVPEEVGPLPELPRDCHVHGGN